LLHSWGVALGVSVAVLVGWGVSVGGAGVWLGNMAATVSAAAVSMADWSGREKSNRQASIRAASKNTSVI